MNDYVNEFVAWFREVRRAQESSIGNYQQVITLYLDWFPDPLTVTPQDIEQFITRERRGGRHPAPASIARDRVMVSSFHRFLQKRGVRVDNPADMTSPPKVHNRQPRAVDDAVWACLWHSDLSDEDRVWLGLCAFAGLRRSEIVSVRAGHVNIPRREIEHLTRKGGGTFPVEYGEIALLTHDRLPQVLPDPEKWLLQVEWLVSRRREDEWLMPMSKGPKDAAVVNRQLRRLLVAAGLQRAQFTPHAMRHMAATNMLRCGVPIHVAADQLSHSSIETTRRYLSTSGQLGRWRREGT